MHWINFIPSLIRPLAAALAILGISQVVAQEVKESPTPEPKSEEASPDATPSETPVPATENEAISDIPLGETFQGLRIPQMGPDGKLQTLFDARTAKRIDDTHIEMEGLEIEIHDEDGSTFHVSMEESMFDLDTRILSSSTPATIRRDDFEIVGERAEFHTRDRFGRMTGDVKMIIFNTDQLE